MMLLLAVCFLAYANGANDNFKRVASFFGSHTTGYRSAIRWTTIATLSGSICSIVSGGITADDILRERGGTRLDRRF